MIYKSKEQFLLDYGVRKTFYCDYFKNEEMQGVPKLDIMANALRNRLVKSPRVLGYTYEFYEKIKDQIGWIEKDE